MYGGTPRGRRKGHGCVCSKTHGVTFNSERDDQRDDPRFDGPGTSSVISLENLMIDASDCRKQCENQSIWLPKAQ